MGLTALRQTADDLPPAILAGLRPRWSATAMALPCLGTGTASRTDNCVLKTFEIDLIHRSAQSACDFPQLRWEGDPHKFGGFVGIDAGDRDSITMSQLTELCAT